MKVKTLFVDDVYVAQVRFQHECVNICELKLFLYNSS